MINSTDLFSISLSQASWEEIDDAKFNVKIVGIKLTPDYESGKASYTIEYITEVSKEEIERLANEEE